MRHLFLEASHRQCPVFTSAEHELAREVDDAGEEREDAAAEQEGFHVDYITTDRARFHRRVPARRGREEIRR